MQQLSLLDEPVEALPRLPRDARVDAAAPAAEVQALAGGLDPRLRLGTSSWSFPGWAGLIYAAHAPRQTLSRHGLSAYARHPLLRTVGVDSGFYAPLNAARLARYAEQVPLDFRFLVKAPAAVTDRFRRDGQGRAREPNPGFLDARLAIAQAVDPYLTGLGDRAGVLLFQFPPQAASAHEPLGDGARRFAEGLYRFLRRLPTGPTYAVELRDTALLTPDFAAALHHGGAVPALAGHPRLPPLDAQRELFAEHDDGPLVIRWLLRRNRGYKEARDRYLPFDRLCEPDTVSRRSIADQVQQALDDGRKVFVIVNNKAEGSSPLTLIELARLLGE